MIPSPADLTYFLAVADLSNLSRASERLGISQPSLTLAMQRLEEAVGTAILIRHKRGVTLTKAGKQLLMHARQLLEHWDTIRAETLASTTEIQGCFTLGCHPAVARYSLPRFLAELLEQHPQLEIKLHHDASRRVTEHIINLSVDIGIVVNPVRHPDLVIKKLDDDKITLWHGHSNRQIQDIKSERALLICDTELTQTQVILKSLKKQGMAYSRILPTNNLDVIADLAESGCGIGIIPGSIAASRKLTRTPNAPYYDDEICLLYHGQNRNVKAIQVIADAIKNGFK